MRKSGISSTDKVTLMYHPLFQGAEGVLMWQVRDKNERWIRCALEKGDFMILPAGIYHRFTPAEGNFTHAMRLFRDEPKWTPYPRREGGEFPERESYLQQIDAAGK
jgi:1,2-dihydroxy-3-keto-5-methylthiopentene dioxygenase